ncbi:MAG: DUF3800 domain-containing protein [Alphaproteobacteria bacterium CG_4_10_14_0_2_um_filter_63_37]|nr:MAG: 3-deoxy-D-manno-octulosonic acid transferase [Proteobacteria bacterium CG1_02_64_396]PJA25136.1 MAG: DUF3800 domain-containing protein [Alphaproteobacteria bacterium CG_4_10_14_0_2_um_filter_63_37]
MTTTRGEPGQKHSDFIVYVDESGDHSLESIDPEYPVFVLSFCIFRKEGYAEQVTPAIRLLKFATFGHDMVVLHESDIRRKRGAFSRLSKGPREAFLSQLTQLIEATEFQLVAVVIDKKRLKGRYTQPAHPYHLALEFGLERIYRLLKGRGQDDALTFLVCEARGAKEDAELELEFRRIRDGDNYFARRLPFDLIVADKKTNSEGLQLADLTARPIGLSVLRPDQENRAMTVLRKKFYRNGFGKIEGMGLKVFP